MKQTQKEIVHKSKESILKTQIAYAIMPVGKKVITSPCGQRMNPPTVVQHSRGILLVFYSGQAPTRLFVVLVVPVKPFDNEVANHTAHDSN